MRRRKISAKKYFREMTEREAERFWEEHKNDNVNISPQVILRQFSKIINDFLYDGFTVYEKGKDYMICNYFTGQIFKIMAVEVTEEEKKHTITDKLLAD